MHDDIEDWLPEDGYVYHGTSSKHVPGILAEGLDDPSCWGSHDMARYFAREECKEAGGKPRIFARRLSAFDEASLRVDEQAVDFPMSGVIGIEYDVLGYAWEELGEDAQDWRAALRIFQSVECTERVRLTEGHLLEGRNREPERDPDATSQPAP